MTTPFDGNPVNPFADTSAPAQQEPAQQSPDQSQTPGQAINPFADVVTQPSQPTQQPPQPAPQSPLGGQSPVQHSTPLENQAQQQPVFAQSPAPQAPSFGSAPAFGAAPQASFGGGNGFGGSNHGGNGRKYKIFDLYWLVNQKLYNGTQLDNGEVAVLNISYNVDFDNLRLSFCTPGQDTFTATGMELKSMERKTTVNICAEVAEQITDLITIESGRVNNLERVFQNNNNWAPNQTMFVKEANAITITTKTRNGETYVYTLQEWQLKALNHACIFLLKEARVLALSKLGIG